MIYVYILQSVEIPERYYVGVTGDLRSQLTQHNSGEVPHASKYTPWTIKTYIAFSDESHAFAFEKPQIAIRQSFRQQAPVTKFLD